MRSASQNVVLDIINQVAFWSTFSIFILSLNFERSITIKKKAYWVLNSFRNPLHTHRSPVFNMYCPKSSLHQFSVAFNLGMAFRVIWREILRQDYQALNVFKAYSRVFSQELLLVWLKGCLGLKLDSQMQSKLPYTLYYCSGSSLLIFALAI